ncbi:hypothetical protein JB92DRAFT_3118083 [Gautieria morchelliformis]|nr:hypothetical protein JB92DRAFT_3118083 [Gautieria morchelliformis]
MCSSIPTPHGPTSPDHAVPSVALPPTDYVTMGDPHGTQARQLADHHTAHLDLGQGDRVCRDTTMVYIADTPVSMQYRSSEALITHHVVQHRTRVWAPGHTGAHAPPHISSPAMLQCNTSPRAIT